MTDPFLMDTHILLWYAKGEDKLTDSTRKLIESPDRTACVSMVSLWEITIKSALGKLDLGGSYSHFMSLLAEQNFVFIDIDRADLAVLHMLPFHHSDPFDRLLIAQAIARSWPLVSDDGNFSQYPVNLIRG
jgi:PIN domain nuclease of toxin-antitoxin system